MLEMILIFIQTRIVRKQTGELLLNKKFHVSQDNFSFVAVTKLSLTNLKFTRYNASLTYRAQDFDIVAQQSLFNLFYFINVNYSISTKGKSLGLGELNLAGYYRYAGHKFGTQLAFRNWEKDVADKFSGVVGGIFKVDNRNTLKAKVIKL